jgi:hypothetical protein
LKERERERREKTFLNYKMSTETLLTGDELVIDGPNYSIKSRNGEKVFLGKLLIRYKGYSHFHETVCIHNNVFVFENTPKIVSEERLLSDCHNIRIFYEVYSSNWYVLK